MSERLYEDKEMGRLEVENGFMYYYPVGGEKLSVYEAVPPKDYDSFHEDWSSSDFLILVDDLTEDSTEVLGYFYGARRCGWSEEEHLQHILKGCYDLYRDER